MATRTSTRGSLGSPVAGLVEIAVALALAWVLAKQPWEQGPQPLPSPAPGPSAAPAAAAASTSVRAAPRRFDQLARPDFNHLAVELDLPLFWIADTAGDGAIDPDELAVLWGVSDAERPDWVTPQGFTARFADAYARMAALQEHGPPVAGLSPEERARRAAVRKELGQGRPTLVRSSLRGASPQDRALVEQIMAAATLVERIYAQQTGAAAVADKVPADDQASQMLWYRNQGPWCAAPETEHDANCHALPARPKQVFGLYPAELQARPGFCEELAKRPDGEKLLHELAVVSGSAQAPVAVPYHQAYRELVQAVSTRLQAAAAAIHGGAENALEAYRRAAAQAFLDDGWEPADEAWAKMSARNSKWYLRIGPDEIYFEPCSRKAGFHVSFARVNQDSLLWQDKLRPVQGDMEKALGALAGKPYQAREVSFQLPDFIDIVLNAGDSRDALGGTSGQSLPNFGRVASEGRGRTVVMTNLYTDADSKAARREQAASLLCADAFAAFTAEPLPQVVGTVLHEAAHNLGPSSEYEVGGKKASQIFGGPLASILEELKAQTSSLYFASWLAERGILERSLARPAQTTDVVWAFSHIAGGLSDSSGKPKPYAQLAAIQIGFLRQEGAIGWRDAELAQNGKDQGCFALDLDRLPAAVQKLLRQVAGIKARGDKRAAAALRKKYVEDSEPDRRLHAAIRERWLRAPKPSFVYSIEL
ncbi:MAG: hypothetical protein HY744_22890 [Deltaproteobacteria bacterium]|nr:hypothetical protein [Deltaproteobacteria bacterium]